MSKSLAFALLSAAACTTSNTQDTTHPAPGLPVTVLCDPRIEACPPIASNEVSQALSLVSAPTDLVLGTGEIDVDHSTFTPNGSSVAQPLVSVELPAQPGGVPIRVFVVKSLSLTGNLVMFSKDDDFGPAVAFAATSDIEVGGRIFATTGAIDIAGCSGAPGVDPTTGSGTAAGGGGAFATNGGHGGALTLNGAIIAAPAAGGNADLDATLVPLRGGCPGGPAAGRSDHGVAGGAIQMFSATRIDIAGAIIADANNSNAGDGGGAGGGILLEAPEVSLGDTAVLTARGQGGASGDTSTMWAPTFGSALPGAVCQFSQCGTGGEGAVGASANGVDGTNVDLGFSIVGAVNDKASGAGGGGIGTIRVNTYDGTLEGSAAFVSGAFSVGTIATQR